MTGHSENDGARLPSALRALAGTLERPSRFSPGQALFVDGREIVHRDRAGTYDVRLTRPVISGMRGRLRDDPRISLRDSSSSDWVEVTATDAPGEALLVELVTLAVAANRKTAAGP